MRDHARVEAEFAALSRSVDPADPWSHPDAARLDSASLGDWLRAQGARPGVIRYLDHMNRSLSIDSVERTSLLGQLRKEAAAGGHGFYDESHWEHLRVAEGSATVALLMAEALGERLRLGAPVRAIEVASSGCAVSLADGERLEAEAVVSALPVGPLRDVEVSGVSPERLRSLHRQRHAIAFKTVVAYPDSFWKVGGATTDGVWASVWIQRDGVLSALTPPDRVGPFLATSAVQRREEFLATVARMMGDEALEPILHAERLWGVDPYTQGYITSWRPGDVMAVGPLHGTHEPPFYVCGSDQWVAGYMEGAVRTGRDAASHALGRGPREFPLALGGLRLGRGVRTAAVAIRQAVDGRLGLRTGGGHALGPASWQAGPRAAGAIPPGQSASPRARTPAGTSSGKRGGKLASRSHIELAVGV